MTNGTVAEKGAEKTVIVTVNGKPVEVDKHTTVSAVLSAAGYDPKDHYLVLVKEGREVKEYRNVEEKINLHNGEEFRAYFTGATPLS